MSPFSPIKIVLADDHQIFREGFKTIFKSEKDLSFVGEAANGNQLCEMVQQHHPDIVITDVAMPGIDGIEASRLIKKKYPSVGIVALSMYADDFYIKEMIEAGASAYLCKNAEKKEMLQCIHTVSAGEYYYTSATLSYFKEMIRMGKSKPSSHSKHISAREKQIIQLICKEYSTKEIAAQLHLSIRTVEEHRVRIQKKMGVKNLAGMIIYAIKKKLFDL